MDFGRISAIGVAALGLVVLGGFGKELLDQILLERGQRQKILQADLRIQRNYTNEEQAVIIVRKVVEELKKMKEDNNSR
jgi:hypothetical protein